MSKRRNQNVGQTLTIITIVVSEQICQASQTSIRPRDSHLEKPRETSLHQDAKSSNNSKVEDRTKDRRLWGSDLYVARLCWKHANDDQSLDEVVAPSNKAPRGVKNVSMPLTDPESQPKKSPTGSLHDELRCSMPLNSQPDASRSQPTVKRPVATLSKPCYRCLSYMHFVGIKRVFWTNEKGEFEGAKVQELMDAFESPDISSGLRSLFVTKHEALALRAAFNQ